MVLNSVVTYAGVAVVAAFFFLPYINSHRSIKRYGKPLRKPPNTLPLVGNGILFLQARQKLFAWFTKCERLYPHETLALSVPSLPPGVLISDPKNLEFVFRNEGLFTKGDFVKTRSWDLFGNGIINSSGEMWTAQRKAGLSFLNTANLKVLTHVVLPQNLAHITARMEQQVGQVVDLQHVFHEITTMLMGKMAYNRDDLRADDDFSLAFDYASGKTAERFQNPLWRVTEIFFGAGFRKSLATVKAYGEKLVAGTVHDRRMEASAKDGAIVQDGQLKETSGTLIQSLLDVIPREDVVADSALNYLSAGRDTTGQSLTWCFYLLMRHGHVAAKIRNEVQAILGDDHLDADTQTRFTPSAMPYTMAVFYETLRLYPPIPFEIRQTSEATTLPDGTFLPRHAVLVWCLWAFGRSSTTYGDDVDEFRPERWLVLDGEGGRPRLVSRPASEFPVFNGGPRVCLGRRMAEMIATQVLGTMLWLFDFEPTDGEERVSKSSMTLPMQGGLPVWVKHRSYM